MARRGLTLSEVILAMAVAAMAVIGIATLIAAVYRANKEGKYQSAASVLARSEIERLRGDQDELQRLVTLARPETTVRNLPIDDHQVAFNCTLSLRLLPEMQSRYADTQCTVRWEQQGRVREVALETYLPTP